MVLKFYYRGEGKCITFLNAFFFSKKKFKNQMLESTGPQNNYIRYLQKVFLLIGRGYHYGEKKLKTNKKNLICIHMSYLFDGT